jgi:hypothetical protein
VMSILAFASFSLLIFTLYLISKVHRLLKFQDKVLFFSLVSLALSLLCMILTSSTLFIGFLLYCTLCVVGNFVSDDNFLNASNFVKETDFAKVQFLFLALMFDLYKWCIFLIGTRKNIDGLDSSSKFG